MSFASEILFASRVGLRWYNYPVTCPFKAVYGNTYELRSGFKKNILLVDGGYS